MIRRPPRSTLFPYTDALPIFEQADGTGWMAMYSLNLLAIAMELAKEDPSYEDVASKFWEHFLATRSEEHTSELQSRFDLVCRLLLEKKKNRGFKFRIDTESI